MSQAPVIFVTAYCDFGSDILADAIVIHPVDFGRPQKGEGRQEFDAVVGDEAIPFKWWYPISAGIGQVRGEPADSYYDRCDAAARRHGQNGIPILGKFRGARVDAPFLVLPSATVVRHYDVTIQLIVHSLSDLPAFDEFKLGYRRFGSPHFRAAAFNLTVAEGYSLPVYIKVEAQETACALEIGDLVDLDMFRARLHVPDDIGRPHEGAAINSRAMWIGNDGPVWSEKAIGTIRG